MPIRLMRRPARRCAPDTALGRGARLEQPRAARGFQLLDLALNEREALDLALELRLQLSR